MMMNATELAMSMLRWGELQQQADALAADIQAAVLAIGKTQTVGNVRASYSTGRTVYDWEATARIASLTVDETLWTDVVRSAQTVQTDWKVVVEYFRLVDGEIQPIVKAQGEPSVSLKFVK